MTRSGLVMDLWVQGQRIRATGEHPFWVVGKGWVVAASLKAGDEFLTSDLKKVVLERVVARELPWADAAAKRTAIGCWRRWVARG